MQKALYRVKNLHNILTNSPLPKAWYFVVLIVISTQLRAEISPKEGSKLNYRLIGFWFQPDSRASDYKIEIASGAYNLVDSFQKNIIASASGNTNRIISEVPSFGRQYTWRVVYSGKKVSKKESILYHFSTLSSPHVDTGNMRLRILHAAEPAYKDDYVCTDGGGVIYDMSGHPVWYLPDTNGYTGYVADMQFTPAGTITFISDRHAFDINYHGDVLWQTPNESELKNDNAQTGLRYHHEFTRLSNGHYMILGMKQMMCKLVAEHDSTRLVIADTGSQTDGFKRGRFGSIIEYDEHGAIAWSWDLAKYLQESDFKYFNPTDSNIRFDAHDNSFFFDEKDKIIYLGFRNLNRIIKIRYPGGEVLNTYGEIFKPGSTQTNSGLFCNQHSVGRSQDGYLYYFNNNSCNNIDALPSVVMLKEPAPGKGDPEKIWEYICTVEGNYPKKFPGGGSVLELPDRSLFVCMGSDYSKIFIVNRNKEILWSALPETYVPNERRWKGTRQYRANIISRHDMERLIWNSEAQEYSK
jgi:arylsulfotransferase ASST